ncbi:BMP family lipoprotein [Oceanivirga salmonicida]|uniref:BMP family lipoprotein n=1 Tax=Oceanivirga salmonicida TaxID=1769291 RepID=UPI00082DDCF9|nr:BMP family ABC transporter substrate-binding protein [Oceanivirga salmonicida]
MKKILKLLSSVLMLVALLVSCGSNKENTAAKTDDMAKKIAIVFSTGGLGDKSFNDSANRGLKMAVEKLGISYDYYEPKDPSAEAQNQLSNYAEKGDYELIIAVGFSMKDSLVSVAKEFPNQKFALIDEIVEDLPNVQSLMFKEQEGSFLVGALAVMMSKTGTIGFVGGIDVPVIQRFQSGYTQGAKYVNPDIKIIETFVNGSNPFNDPVSAKALTSTMIQQGADVIFHAAGASGSGVFQAAKEAGVYAIGVDSNQDDVEKGTVLTSMLKKVDNAVFTAVKDTLEGNYTAGVKFFGLAEDGVSTTDFEFTRDIIGEERIQKLDEISKEIKDGKIKVKQYLK